ncbi:MAG: hypothetical protein M3Q07_20020, partial [Pseudobdellovibrionaceae bacterium]|nr:hypothetical protein [Pseudobdellovibrionaceae bacterium]
LYFKIRMNAAQFATVQKLAHSGSGIVLTGSVAYAYETSDGPNQTSASLVGVFDDESLRPRPNQGRYGLEWIVDLFANYELHLEGSLDGRYSLGALAVNFEQSMVQMKLDTSRTDFNKQDQKVLMQHQGENAKGRIQLYIRELQTAVALDVRYAISGSIDLLDARVTINSIELTDVSTPDVTAQPFIIKALNNHLKSPKVKQRLSQDLSHGLQDRILSGDLFL